MVIDILLSLVILFLLSYLGWNVVKLWDVVIRSENRLDSIERHLKNLKEMVFDYHKED